MSCEEWREDVSAWVDGELQPKQWIAVDAHIKSCRACSRLVREFRTLTVVARRAPTPRASSRLTAAAMALVHERGRRGRSGWGWNWNWWPMRRMFWPQVSLAVSGLAVAALFGLIVVRGGMVPFPSDTHAGSSQKMAIAAVPSPSESQVSPPSAPVAAAVPSPLPDAPSIAGRLIVENPAVGVERLATLARSLGGSANPAGAPYQSTVYVSIPRSARDKFQARLSEIGNWQTSSAKIGDGSVMGIQIVQKQ